MLWESQVPEAVQAMLANVEASAQAARREEFETLALFYRGGDELKGEVTRHLGEKGDHYTDRLRRFSAPNFFARGANEFIQAISGGEIRLEFAPDTASDEQQARLSETLSYNHFRDYTMELGKGVVVRGGIYNLTAWDERAQRICLHTVLPENCTPYVDWNDPRRLGAVVEQRDTYNSKGEVVPQFWAWANPGYDPDSPQGWGRLYNEGGGQINAPNGANFDPNPYGRIPYTYFRGRPDPGLFEGLSYVRDSLTIQRALINGLSDLDTTVYMQGWGQPVIKDHQEPKATTGQVAAIYVGPDGDYFYASPNAPIDEVAEHWQRRIDYMFQTNSIPIDVIRGQVAESGVALVVKWAPFKSTAEAGRNRFTNSLQETVRVICAVGRAHGVDFPDPEDLYGDGAPVATYNWDVIPSDEERERLNDKEDVLQGLMPRWEYIRKWREGIDTEEQAKEYLAEMEEDEPEAEAEPEEEAQNALEGNLLL